MSQFARLLVAAAICAASAAGAQVARAPVAAPPAAAVVSVPMVPTPLTVRVEVQRSAVPPPSLTPSLPAATIPPPAPTIGNAVAASSGPASSSPAPVAAEATEQTAVDVQVVPPPDEARESPDADCKVDDDNDVTTPPRDCPEVAAADAEDWALNADSNIGTEVAVNAEAPAGRQPASRSRGWLIGAGVAFALLLGIALLRRR